MHTSRLPLNALRAFEAAARHLSFSKAAEELHVTPSALSHQISGLEDLLDLKLFERKVRAIALTPAGKLLYPGLQTGFAQIREAVEGLTPQRDDRVLVISTPPGFTAKWLAPRLYRFSVLNPDIDARISSSMANANFRTDGVDIAVRNLPVDHESEEGLVTEKMMEISLVPVCSPKFLKPGEAIEPASLLRRAPLIHDESFSLRVDMPGWSEWLKLAKVDDIDIGRGLTFNHADHALDAAIEGAGLLLAHSTLAHDDLATGRLVQPFDLTMPTGRAYFLVYPAELDQAPNVVAFRDWIRAEVEEMSG